MDENGAIRDPSDFASHLRALQALRSDGKVKAAREHLSRGAREQIFNKTGGLCHICGGMIERGQPWDADHVFSHSLGGAHALNNYLPAHRLCNNYRWFYLSEEFQWILKLGVWLRTQIKSETPIGRHAAKAFLAHEAVRSSRALKQTHC